MKPSHDPLASLRKAPGIVRLHGHRGARGIWPENTMFGFKNTLDLGVRVVELDILLTRDEIPVVTHNPTLMAATTRDEHGLWVQAEDLKISDFTFEELKRVWKEYSLAIRREKRESMYSTLMNSKMTMSSDYQIHLEISNEHK